MQLLADAGLEGSGRQPLFGQAALEEGHAGTEVGQAVDPARNLSAAQDLRRDGRLESLRSVGVSQRAVVEAKRLPAAPLLFGFLHAHRCTSEFI